MHHLVGLKEIAELLGVSRQRAHQLVRRADFPPPEAQLAAGAVWQTAAVTAWIDATGERRPGRPKASHGA